MYPHVFDWQAYCDDDGLIENLSYSTDWENQAWHLSLTFQKGLIINTLSIAQQGLKADADTRYFESRACHNIIPSY